MKIGANHFVKVSNVASARIIDGKNTGTKRVCFSMLGKDSEAVFSEDMTETEALKLIEKICS